MATTRPPLPTAVSASSASVGANTSIAETPATLAARALHAPAVPPPDARQRISAAAFRLFSQKGYSCTSVHDIAEEAGVQKSVLYYYFDSKEGLYHTLLSESASRLRGMLDVSLNGTGICCPIARVLSDAQAQPSRGRGKSAALVLPARTSVTQLLGQFVETLLGAARDNREPVRFFMAHIFAPDADRPPDAADDMQKITPRITQHLVKLGHARGELRGDADLLERLLLGAVQYSITRHLRSPEQEPLLPGTGQRIVRALIQGFAAKPAPSRRAAPAKRTKAPAVKAAPKKTSRRRPAANKKR